MEDDCICSLAYCFGNSCLDLGQFCELDRFSGTVDAQPEAIREDHAKTRYQVTEQHVGSMLPRGGDLPDVA